MRANKHRWVCGLAVLPLSLLMLVSFGGCAKSRTRAITIGVVPMGTTHDFWKAIHAGAQAAAQELGVKIIWKGPLKEDDRNEQVQIVETLCTAGIAALALTPIDDRALMPAVAEARKSGIPTVIFNSPLQGNDFISYIATDNWRGGVLAAELLGRLLNGRGNLILLRVTEGVKGTRQREEGFLKTIRENFPAIRILSDNQYAGVTTETAYQTCENLFSRYPQVNGLFTPNESSTFGAWRALQDMGLTGKVIHVGFDSSAKLVEALAKREIRGLVLQDPLQMGYQSVRVAVACLRNQPYPAEIKTAVALATPENMNEGWIHKLLVPDLSILNE